MEVVIFFTTSQEECVVFRFLMCFVEVKPNFHPKKWLVTAMHNEFKIYTYYCHDIHVLWIKIYIYLKSSFPKLFFRWKNADLK